MARYRTGGTPWTVIVSPDGGVVYDGFRVDGDKAIEFFKAVFKEQDKQKKKEPPSQKE